MPTPELAATFGRLAANHLWQSTGFAAAAVLLALALRANHARARYWLWLAASVKFLVPFSVLAAIGSGLGRWLAPATPVSRLPFVMEQIVQPFAPIQDASVPGAASVPATTNLLPALLLALWLCGFVAVLLYGWSCWRRVAAAIHLSTPLTEGRELEALWKVGRTISLPRVPRLVSSSAKLEPGVFGIFRPVLWLPAGIGDRLDDAELEAILAHELCHIRRRDNLLATIHMAVEAIFWFHPLVWWLGARLEEERERACDEEVVRMGGEPQIYAEGILKVCEFYLASPVACAAGVTGGELKKRIEGIMTNRFTCKLSHGKKMLLASAAILVIAAPIVVGLLNPPRGRAQARTAPLPSFEVASVKSAAATGLPDYWYRMTGGPRTNSPGQFICTHIALRALLLKAYELRSYQVVGPTLIDRGKYDIDAKIPPGATDEQFDLMLRDLLITRFGLAAHREMRHLPIYELVVAKGGPKLKEPEKPPVGQPAPAQPEPPADGRPPTIKMSLDKDGNPELPPGIPMMYLFGRNGASHISARMQTVAALLHHLEEIGLPVVDKTGLTGMYDFNLTFVRKTVSVGPPAATEPPSGQAGVLGAPSDPAPDLFAALESQLGLKLESAKGPVEVLVVDHVNRVPTEN
jgi:bla regulator protein BlaR1